MGKKKSGKKTGGKKKGGKKKKSAEPQMTFKEAILAYQINIKEKQMEDVQYELKAVEEKNKRHKERNERLKEEQEFYMKNLLKQAREFEKKLAEEDIVDKEKVIIMMKDKWAAAKEEERNVTNMRNDITELDHQIAGVQRDVTYWTDYKNRGQHEHMKQIQLLEQELLDMQNSFDEMSAHLERTLNKAKDEIQQHTDSTLDKQKDIASDKALAKMDKYSRQEVIDNDWLQKEVEIHKYDADELMKEVEELEKENLEIMGELFECTVDDLKISRQFFLTQFVENENLDETGILEMDLAKVSLKDKLSKEAQFIDESNKESQGVSRPKSAMQLAVEKKVLSLPQYELLDSDEESEIDYDGKNADEESDPGDPFENYFQFEDENFQDYLKLGPLELKLLNIEGTKATIHKPKTPSPEEMRAKAFKPDQWPITGSMLQNTLTPRKK